MLVGNFSYVAEPLKLGNLSGNRFGIVLRNITLPNSADNPDDGNKEEDTQNGTKNAPADQSEEISSAVGGDVSVDTTKEDTEAAAAAAAAAEESLLAAGDKLREVIDQRCQYIKDQGFINYFGLQRFGTGGAPTSEVGLAMLKEDWEGAVRLIMTPRIGENEATHDSKVRAATQHNTGARKAFVKLCVPAGTRIGSFLFVAVEASGFFLKACDVHHTLVHPTASTASHRLASPCIFFRACAHYSLTFVEI